ncbi:RHS repeat-associated core domain-containing protein [archaeon]|jgi:RHS repeat-associated protein|nr:RHS repeat-associated core domain-containing protein [archaeon]
MKRVVVLLMFFICVSFSYAEILDVPGVREPEQIRDEFGTKKFVYAGNNIVASVKDSGIDYYHSGRLSNRIITGSDGVTDSNFKSLPFGQKIVDSGIDYPFTGKEEDESSLYYFGARYYDDNLGIFVSVDPIEENQPYSYVRNNPLNRIDPDGMEDGKVESLYFYSVDTSEISRFRPADMNPLFFDTFASDPSDTTNIHRFESYLDSIITATAQDTVGMGKFNLNSWSDYYDTIYLEEPDTLWSVSSYDLAAIPQVVKEFAEGSSPIENLVFTFHGMPLDSLWKSSTGFTQDYAFFAQATDSTAAIYTRESMTDIFLNIDPAHLAGNSRIIFESCYGDFCIDSQAIADSLDTSVYTATTTVSENLRIMPTLVYGNYERHTPKN